MYFSQLFLWDIWGIQEFPIHIHPAFVPHSDQILLCFFSGGFLNTKPSTDVGATKLDYAEELSLKWI